MASRSFGTQNPDVPHLNRGELADLRGDVEAAFETSDGKVGFPAVGKVTGGMALSLGGLPQAAAIAGAGFLQGQTHASLVSGTGTSALTFTANRPGTPGNGISVEIVAGGGALAVAVVSEKITVTLASGGSTADAVKAALDADAAVAALINTASGGTGAVVAAAETHLAGGVGAGLEVKVNGIEQKVTGAVTDSAIPMTVSDLTGCSATDAAVLLVKSNGIASDAVALGVVA